MCIAYKPFSLSRTTRVHSAQRSKAHFPFRVKHCIKKDSPVKSLIPFRTKFRINKGITSLNPILLSFEPPHDLPPTLNQKLTYFQLQHPTQGGILEGFLIYNHPKEAFANKKEHCNKKTNIKIRILYNLISFIHKTKIK